jgi:hypothetical protein
MKLTRMIFDYWKTWMSVPLESNIWANEVLDEGITYFDGYCMSFWYCLNHDWYKMNNKMYAYTGCVEPYEEPRDFMDYEEYWSEK